MSDQNPTRVNLWALPTCVGHGSRAMLESMMPSTHPLPLRLHRARAGLACVLAACLLCGCPASSREETEGTSVSGLLLDPQLSEISGLAASRRHRDMLWLHDDGGNPPRLFAVTTRGQREATFRLDGVPKTDWEDIAAFHLDGRDYLLIADTGDNGGLRRTLQLHIVEEPRQLTNARLTPAWSITFRWPDGPRDCEAVAVDPQRRQVLLISKKREPPEVFSLPLRPASKKVLTAQHIGNLHGVPRPEHGADAHPRARMGSQVTAADISPDGRTLAVMTYRHLLFYRRDPAQGWSAAIAGQPVLQPLPWLPQAEALGWSRDGRSVYVSGEFIPAPLYRIPTPRF